MSHAERDDVVSMKGVGYTTIFRILKKRHWSEKRKQRVGIRQNDELRLNWIADLLQLTAEQLVFVDETLFNETTGWCHQAYASVGESARYQVSRKREHFWSVLWISDELLPHCNAFPAARSVIIMNNASIHCNARIEELITSHGCEVRYLPPYSSDFNSIELSFSVLKAWVRRQLWLCQKVSSILMR